MVAVGACSKSGGDDVDDKPWVVPASVISVILGSEVESEPWGHVWPLSSSETAGVGKIEGLAAAEVGGIDDVAAAAGVVKTEGTVEELVVAETAESPSEIVEGPVVPHVSFLSTSS
jgi:hypothetical protein